MAQLKQGRFELLDQAAIIYGTPFEEALQSEIARRGASSVLLVSTASLAARAQAAAGALTGARVEVETAIPAHSPMPAVFALAHKMEALQADLVVALGGGSVIDAVKIAGLIRAEGIADRAALIARSMQKGGTPKALTAPAPRYVAVPTTLSGAEFGVIGGSVDPETKIKFGFAAPYFCAQTIIYDSALPQATPASLWLSSGVRAIDHAIEGVLSPDANPFIDGCSLQGLELLAAHLNATRADPADEHARQQSQFGVWLATQGVGRVRYGASHGIGHQLGAVAGVPHGYTSCVMLPAAMRWNLSATRDQQARLARFLGAADAADAIGALIESLGLPTRLSDVGVTPDMYEKIAELAMANPFVQANPRPIRAPADIVEILKLAE